MSTKDAKQISDRAALRAYFFALLRTEPGVDPRLAERLAERCVRRVKRIVVWKAAREADVEPVAPGLGAAPLGKPDRETTDLPPAAAEVPVPLLAEPVLAPLSEDPAPAPPPPAADTAEASFDPYAFSAVVVLTKSGPEALMHRLSAITRTEHLHHLAEAQRLAVGRDVAEIDDLRRAIVAAAQKRIQNRRAAAS